jgi:CO/xanthine dehydrogenase FAD-binding subunit
MIADDIVYVGAETAEEAVRAWSTYSQPEAGGIEGVRYLGGGTELVTGARKAASGPARVLIDLKRIPEARRLERIGDRLFLGAALPLNEVGDSGLFPLLSAVVRRIADRTTRNRLSLGGNVAGSLPYREAVLPLLLSDAELVTLAPGYAGGSGSFDLDEPPVRRRKPLRDVFDRRLRLEPGELVLGFSVPADAVALPWFRDRATRTGPVDYPLVSACFLRGPDGVSAALSGLHPYPVLYPSLDAARAALSAPGAAHADQRGSAEYRLDLAAGMLSRAEEELR